MINRPFNQLSLSCRVTLLVLATITLPGMLIVQSFAARAYYNLNSRSLRLVASMAVRAGAEYLPTDPRNAVLIADRCALRYGVTSSEIVSTAVSADDKTLTLRLSRRVPEFMSLLALGLPNRTISVVVSGHSQKIKVVPGRGAPSTEALIDISEYRSAAVRAHFSISWRHRSDCQCL